MFGIVLEFDWIGGADPVRVIARADSMAALRNLPCFDPKEEFSAARAQLRPQEALSVANCETGGSLSAHICSIL